MKRIAALSFCLILCGCGSTIKTERYSSTIFVLGFGVVHTRAKDHESEIDRASVTIETDKGSLEIAPTD